MSATDRGARREQNALLSVLMDVTHRADMANTASRSTGEDK